jgi:phage gpG-like protein
MSVKITGITEIKRQFAAIEEFLASTKPMEGIVKDIKDIILIKTASGLDYMGRGFKPYSEAYAKKKKGMTATGRPNLKASGTMLNAIKTQVINPRHGAVFVASVAEKGKATSDMLAQIHTTGTGKQPQREFMNLAPSAVKKLTKKHYDDPILVLAKQARGR